MSAEPPSTSHFKDRLDDDAIVRLVQSGDKAAFEILVRRHQAKILNLCYRLLGEAEGAQELACDIFAEAFRSLDHFRGTAKFGTWLYRIGLNQIYSHLKRAVRKRALEALLTSADQNRERPIPADTVHPLESFELQEKRLRIRRVLAALSRHHAEILILHDIEGLSYEEISDLTRLPAGTVMSRLSRAREAFRKKWNQNIS